MTRSTFTRCISLVVLVVLMTIAPAPAPVAEAAPTNRKIEEARERAAEARDRLDELAADLEEATEDYLEVEDALAQTRARIASTERELGEATIELDEAESKLSVRAGAIYRSGGTGFIDVLLGATDFRDLVTRLDLMRRVSHSDAVLVGRVKDAKRRIEETQTSLERRREEQTVLRDKAKAARGTMERAVADQKAYLSRLDAGIKRLVAEERERRERIAREQAAEAARRAAQAAASLGSGGREFDADALGDPHPEVVEIARRYVGKVWYVWGGTTPQGFDCSGLTLYSYRAIGINLPRTSRQQYRIGAFIPPNRLDLLRPGDLVFFGRGGDPKRIHHVAIFIGDGAMIHAPQTGEKVSVGSLLGRIARRGDYVGAVRP